MTLGGGGYPPANPVFFAVQQGKAQLRGREAENLFGFCWASCGIPRHNRDRGRDLPGLRDDPKNCSGYCTRQELGKQPGIFYLEILPAWENAEQLFGITRWTTGFPAAWENAEQLFGLCPGAGTGDLYKFFYI